jgi:hypothetical protein
MRCLDKTISLNDICTTLSQFLLTGRQFESQDFASLSYGEWMLGC